MENKKNILIVGAGVAGRELLLELHKHFKNYYKVIGFVDDNSKIIGKKIKNIPVLGFIDDLENLITEHKITEVFIAIPSAQGSLIRRIIEKCQNKKIVFKVVPRILEIVQGKVKLNQIREISIEDLLGRAIVKADQKIFKSEFVGKKILVTGAAGSIGAEICTQIIQFNPKKLIAFDWWENGMFELETELNRLGSEDQFIGVIGSIQEYEKIYQIIEKFKPDMIFHAAAFKHVPLMQRHPEEAIKNNVLGTFNVAKAAYLNKVKKFIYISTDKAADPVNAMGATKLVGEKIVAYFNKSGVTKYSAVRFGNVLGSHGSVVPLFRKQILNGGPITVTDREMVRFFMTIPEAVQLVLQASILGKGGEIFILDMGEPVKIYELAKLMISLAGFVPEKEIEIKFTGSRPGEKISEILNSENEILEQTSNQKIFMVKNNFDSDRIIEFVDGLRIAAAKKDTDRIYNILKNVAPNLIKLDV